MSPAADYGDKVLHNVDVNWDEWPVDDYIAENYRELHPSDAAVIDHHSRYLSQFRPGTFHRSLELGAGPNLYPLMLVSSCSQTTDAVEPGAASVRYLREQLAVGPDRHWGVFLERARALNPALPAAPQQALRHVRVIHAAAASVAPDGYGLVSMHFVAEGVSDVHSEFVDVCRTFVHAAQPGGHIIAAFMENLGAYTIADGPRWPAFPVNADIVHDTFSPMTEDLALDRIDADPTLPDYGYTGMLMLTARRRRE
jgi:hypothetical protein